jgi:hypothetical protein
VTTCARCGREIALVEMEDSWEDGEGCFTCSDWTGHDKNGIFGPSHHPQADMCAAEDSAAYSVHSDDEPCWRCGVEGLGVLDGFRSAATKEELAVRLLEAAMAVSTMYGVDPIDRPAGP